MKYTLDINQVQFKDLDGNDLKQAVEKELGKPFAKALGNALYFSARDIAMLEKGKTIYSGEPVSFTQDEKDNFLQAVLALFSPFVWQCVSGAIVAVG